MYKKWRKLRVGRKSLSSLAEQKAAMVHFFQKNCKEVLPPVPGLKIEHFITHADGRPISLDDAQRMLREMQGSDDTPYWCDGLYLGYQHEKYRVVLEAACQLAVTIAPQRSLQETMKVYQAFDTAFSIILAAHSMQLHTVGYHPTRRAGNLQLIPCARYQILDRYFRQSGSCGGQILRATAATQIFIDYTSERDFVQKYRAACLITPLLALLTDHSPVYQGEANTTVHVRSTLWMDVDPERCGIFPGVMKEDFGFESYADYVLQKPLIVGYKDGKSVEAGNASAAAFYDALLTNEEMKQTLLMFFFDVRLTDRIEVRVADSMPRSYIAAYAQLIWAIFSSPAAQEGVLRHYAGATLEDILAARRAVCEQGFAARVYGHAVTMELAWLLVQAKSRIASAEDRRLLEPFAALLSSKNTIREEEANHE
ncbi:MAG: glutamate-cysteine ligase family protein [Gemmiger sp.]